MICMAEFVDVNCYIFRRYGKKKVINYANVICSPIYRNNKLDSGAARETNLKGIECQYLRKCSYQYLDL